MNKDLCAICGGKKEEKVVQIERWYRGKLYVFKKVPAKVCKKCSEIYLSSESARLMEEKLGKAKPTETIQVPVYTL